MLPSATDAHAVVAWMKVLDRIERTLLKSLAADPEGVIPAFPAVAEAGVPLQKLDERLTRLQTCLDRAETNATEIDTYLQGEVEQMQQHLDQLRAGEQRLADWASGAV